MSDLLFLGRKLSRRQLLTGALGIAGSTLLINHFAFGNGSSSTVPMTALSGAALGGQRRILVTGSTAGIGLLTARLLLEQGHRVVLHGRTRQSTQNALALLPGAERAIVADFSSLSQVRAMAAEANESGPFDAVIHNAGVGYQEPRREVTEDGLPHVFAVNMLAPYVLTALIRRPQRLIYLSSMGHRSANNQDSFADLLWTRRPWSGLQAYRESKLHNTLFAFAIARRWPQVLSNAVDPGWVPTALGGAGASDDLAQSHLTQVWLATSQEPAATVSGAYFYHMARGDLNPDVRDVAVQERLLAACERLSGIALPV